MGNAAAVVMCVWRGGQAGRRQMGRWGVNLERAQMDSESCDSRDWARGELQDSPRPSARIICKICLESDFKQSRFPGWLMCIDGATWAASRHTDSTPGVNLWHTVWGHGCFLPLVLNACLALFHVSYTALTEPVADVYLVKKQVQTLRCPDSLPHF